MWDPFLLMKHETVGENLDVGRLTLVPTSDWVVG